MAIIIGPKMDKIESTPDMAWESDGSKIIKLEDEIFNKVVFMIDDYAYTTQLVADGGTAVEPAEPKLDGKAFDGWYSDSEYTTEFDFDTVINADTTLYSKWVELD